MRKTFTILFLAIVVLYSWFGYQSIANQEELNCQMEGTLSEIAEEVIAIPLETNTHCRLEQIGSIKRDKEHIFLVSNQQLYHFNREGKFLGKITNSQKPIEVIDYVIDPTHSCLIVIGKNKEVHYYDYAGQLLAQRTLPQNASWKTFGHLAYYNHYLWATIDLINTEDEHAVTVEQWLYKFDLNFREIDKRKLEAADLGRININHRPNPEISISPNGQVYVQAPSLQPSQILNDTLYLISTKQLTITEGYSKILPVKIGARFLISLYHNPLSAESSYTFCYDQRKTKAYNIQGGLKDNFYMTGEIQTLQPMDIYNQIYCYYQKGDKLNQSFPKRKVDDNPVLFIVKMKA